MCYSVVSYSQVKKGDLIGTWESNNANGIFFKLDTIEFEKVQRNCSRVEWKIERNKITRLEVNDCIEPPEKKGFIEREKLELKRGDIGQILEIRSENNIIEKFRILHLENQKLKLKRLYDST